jgi:hypothetical protein
MSRTTTHPATLLLLALAAAQPASAHAQEATAQVAVSGGVATDQRGVRSNALTLAPSAAFSPSPFLSIQLGGNATRFANNAHSLGGNVSIAMQEAFGRFAALTLTGNGSASRLSSAGTATFSQADVMPALELRVSRLALFGGLRAAAGNSAERASASLPVPGSETRSSVSRSGAGVAFGGVVSLGNESRALRVMAREDRLRVDGVIRPERSLGASVALALSHAATFEIAGGRYDGNPLLGTPAGEYVSAGLSFRLGGSTREPSLPRPAGEPQRRGTTRLSIRAPEARSVEIAGDFSEWKPLAARRSANGVWYADLSIPPGQYRYAFRIDGKEWRVPDGATAVDDGFGGKAAWVTVSETRPE